MCEHITHYTLNILHTWKDNLVREEHKGEEEGEGKGEEEGEGKRRRRERERDAL